MRNKPGPPGFLRSRPASGPSRPLFPAPGGPLLPVLLAGLLVLSGLLAPSGFAAPWGRRSAHAAPAPAPAPRTGPETGTGAGPDTGPDTGPAAGVGAGAEAGRSWPLAGRPAVLRGWEPPAGPYGPGHRGVDLAAGPGARVLAAAPGRVSFAGRVAGRGVLAIEVDGSGSPPLRTTYEPVRALAEEGDQVRAGAAVGVLEDGPFHCSADCLHWGLRRGDAYLDPLSLLPPSLLRRGPSRLLPVFGAPEPEEAPTGPAEAVHPRAGTRKGSARVSRVRRAGPWRPRCPR